MSTDDSDLTGPERGSAARRAGKEFASLVQYDLALAGGGIALILTVARDGAADLGAERIALAATFLLLGLSAAFGLAFLYRRIKLISEERFDFRDPILRTSAQLHLLLLGAAFVVFAATLMLALLAGELSPPVPAGA